MYRPHFAYTNNIANDLIKISSINEKLKIIKLPDKEKQKLLNQAKLKKTYFSTSIEGNMLSFDQVVNVIENKSQKTFINSEKEVINYWNALEFIENNLMKDDLDLDFILQINGIIRGKRKKSTLRTATPSGTLFAVYNSSTHKPEYIPPENPDVPKLLFDLINWYNNDFFEPVPVKTALFSYQFLTIHPFADGNGRTARILEDWILRTNNYDFIKFGSLEKFYFKNLNNYYKNLQMDLPDVYYFGRKNPPHLEKWIEYFIYNLKLSFEDILEKFSKLDIKDIIPLIQKLSEKEKRLLIYLLRKKKVVIKVKDIVSLFHVSDKTARKWLNKWSNNGFLKPNKVNVRIRSYSLTEAYQKITLNDLWFY